MCLRQCRRRRPWSRAGAEAEIRFHRALDPQRLVDEVGDALASGPGARPGARGTRQVLEADGEQAGRRLLARPRRERWPCARRGDIGGGAVGVGRQAPDGSARRRGARCGGPRCRRRTSPSKPIEGVEPIPSPSWPTGPGDVLSPKTSRNRWWSASGTPSTSATTSMAKGWVYALMNSQLPSATNSSIWRSARPHMNASFSFRRFGVSRRMTRAALACVHGRVHGHHVLVHRELVPVGVDDLADVVTLERHREGGKGADHRVARRERRRSRGRSPSPPRTRRPR